MNNNNLLSNLNNNYQLDGKIAVKNNENQAQGAVDFAELARSIIALREPPTLDLKHKVQKLPKAQKLPLEHEPAKVGVFKLKENELILEDLKPYDFITQPNRANLQFRSIYPHKVPILPKVPSKLADVRDYQRKEYPLLPSIAKPSHVERIHIPLEVDELDILQIMQFTEEENNILNDFQLSEVENDLLNELWSQGDA